MKRVKRIRPYPKNSGKGGECKFCHNRYPLKTLHAHDKGWVCEECWDERLRSTE